MAGAKETGMTQTAGTAPDAAAAVTAASDDVTTIEPRAPRSWWRLIVLFFGALVFLFPFYYMIVGSLQKTANTSLSGVVAAAGQPHPPQLRPDQRGPEPGPGNHQLRHLHRRRPAGDPRVRRTGRICPSPTELSRPRPVVRLHAAAAHRPVPAADHPAVRAHREKLRARRLLPRDDRAVRDQLHRRSHLPAILPAGAERAVRRRSDRRRERAARPDPHRTPARPPRAADRDAADLYRAVERVPVAVPDHQAAEPAATRGRSGQLHQHRVGGRDESIRCDHGRSVRARRASGRLVHRLPAALRVRQSRLRRERLTVTHTVTTSVPFRLTRLGVLMSAEPGAEFEAGGVLNPASGRSPDGRLWLLPRMVAAGNVSRVGIAEILVQAGRPAGVRRDGIVLAPDAGWERSHDHAGVEDPRTTWIASLGVHVMSYVAFGPLGPRPALAVSGDLRSGRPLGPVHFEYQPDLDADLNLYPNKDVVFFPEPVRGPDGQAAYAMLHRPMWDLGAILGGSDIFLPAGLDDPRPGIWISYTPADEVRADVRALTHVRSHRLVAP